jgi:hypothetical protein
VGAKDAGRLGGSRRQQQQQDRHGLQGVHGNSSSSSSSSSSMTRQDAEAELVATACLALQGVWSAVQQLWGLVLQGVLHEDASLTPDRYVGDELFDSCCKPSALLSHARGFSGCKPGLGLCHVCLAVATIPRAVATIPHACLAVAT